MASGTRIRARRHMRRTRGGVESDTACSVQVQGGLAGRGKPSAGRSPGATGQSPAGDQTPDPDHSGDARRGRHVHHPTDAVRAVAPVEPQIGPADPDAGLRPALPLREEPEQDQAGNPDDHEHRPDRSPHRRRLPRFTPQVWLCGPANVSGRFLDRRLPIPEATDMAPESSSPLARWIGHPDFEAFALAIAAAPDDTAPLIVFSDWLRDEGDEAAADLARGPLFPTLLAVARFEKITGRLGAEAVSKMFESFRGAGRSEEHTSEL